MTKLHSICHYCKESASFSVRVTAETKVKVVGGPEKYRPACRDCYFAIRDRMNQSLNHNSQDLLEDN